MECNFCQFCVLNDKKCQICALFGQNYSGFLSFIGEKACQVRKLQIDISYAFNRAFLHSQSKIEQENNNRTVFKNLFKPNMFV